MLTAKGRREVARVLISGLVSLALSMAQAPSMLMAQESSATPNASSSNPGPAPGGATQEQLQQMVSPIALYPDFLVAQILAGSTYPTQIVEADRWLADNKNLQGQQLADAVNAQPWDPSIKSLTQYPPVLDNMNQNLSWTSALGQAYYNQPSDVMKAIQTLRKMAKKAGTLKSTPQQNVTEESASSGGGSAAPSSTVVSEGASGNQVIVIQPAQPTVVYVPQYNPTTAYGAPMAAPVGYSSTDLMMTGLVSFGAGMLVGSLIDGGSNNWGCNWHGGNVTYNKNVYVSNSNAVPSRWGYGSHPGQYGSHPYYGSNRYAGSPRPNSNYNRSYATNNTMPKSYDQPKYNQNWQNAKNNPQYQKDYQNAKNNPKYQQDYQNHKGKSANDAGSDRWSKSSGSNRADDSSRGYGSSDSRQNSQRSWGGRTQPAGDTQRASQRGSNSFRGGGRSFGGGGGGFRRR